MKKTILTALLAIILTVPAFGANIIQTAPNGAAVRTVGTYQVGNDITIYRLPNKNSMILYRVRWNEDEFFPSEIGAENFFSLFVQSKDLARVNVVDITEDWVEIVYDNKTGKTGWIRNDDLYKFMTWTNFYSAYGKKYGLKMLKGVPACAKDLKSAPDDKSQTLATINVPQKIHLNLIQGNWMLISVMDLDKIPKTGYVRWRSDDGVRYFYPDIR